MAKYERERKFLVNPESLDMMRRMAERSIEMVQGYLSRRPESTVRVRIAGDRAWLTVKGISDGDLREEYEYQVPVADARRMLSMCEGSPVEKIRRIVPWDGLSYEVDEFGGRHAGLVVCEVELPLDFSGELDLPPFVGEEVTGDPRYYNSAM